MLTNWILKKPKNHLHIYLSDILNVNGFWVMYHEVFHKQPDSSVYTPAFRR